MADTAIAHGLNNALGTFYDVYSKERGRRDALAQAEAQSRNKQTESLMEARSKGLIPDKDESGQITGYGYDPEYFKLKSENDPYKGLIQAMTAQKLSGDLNEQKRKADEAAYKKTPEGRLEAAGGDVKQRVGYAAVGRQSAKKLMGLLESGEQPSRINPGTPYIGSFVNTDPIYQNLQVMAEQYGRLQSGGAINKDEEARFLSRGPRPGDTPDVQKQKVQQMVDEFESKAKIYGAGPETLEAYAPVGGQPGREAPGGAFAGRGGVSPGTKLSPEQRSALIKQLSQ